MSEFEFLAVLDFEATCAERSTSETWDVDLQEIIEIPVGLVSVERREVVRTFGTFVQPVRQPRLTPFCTNLTSIRQEDVEGAPTIAEAIEQLEGWFEGVTADNCCVVTCGDWDLKTMWPNQASLVPGLRTPELFRRWCNLKVVYSRVTGEQRRGMMGMLRTLGLEHEGHHHRGADDVRNLCKIVIELLGRGAEFEATWGAEERVAERERWASEVARQKALMDDAHGSLVSLPDTVGDGVHRRLAGKIAARQADVERLERIVGVFS